MHRAISFICLLIFVFLAACSAHDSALDRVLSSGVLRVGTEPEFKPFESKNEEGELVGFDMDLARELAKDLGVELEFVELPFASLIPALRTGKIDLAISGMTATEERALSVSFTDSYFETGLCLLVNRESGIEDAASAGELRLVVKQGTTGQINAERLFPAARITVMRNEGACVNEVATNRADAFLYDQLSVLGASKAHAETTKALLTPLTREPYAMAVSHGDERMRARLNEFLRTIREDGRYAALREQYLKDLPDGSK